MKKLIFVNFIIFYIHCENLIDIQQIIPKIELDIKYATENNFTKKQIYSKPKCYLLESVAKALKKANNQLKHKGYKLKIFDGYRPMDAQRKMWEFFPDPRYVSDPNKEFGRHTRGTSVDVTLIKLDGSSVEMPSEFDSFEERSHSNYSDLPQNVIKNRKLLQDTMIKSGFNTIKCEWWHFDYKNWQDYPTLNISFEELEKRNILDKSKN